MTDDREALGLDPSTADEVVARMLEAMTPLVTEPEPYPFGDGTAEDPYVVPPGFTLETTQAEALAMRDAATPKPKV